MSTYVDTSAILAVMDAGDQFHEQARAQWASMLDAGESMVCSSCVLLETYALVQHRLGMAAVRVLHEDIYPVICVDWTDYDAHQQAISALLVASRKDLSLVDCVSFITMRRLGLRVAFAFDKHFAEQGFEVTPVQTR